MSALAPMVRSVFIAIAKTKQKTYKAMKGAFDAAKNTAGAFGVIGNTLRLLSPILKIFGIFGSLLRIIGASMMKTLMPSFEKLLELLTSDRMLAIMEKIGELLGTILIPALELFMVVLEFLIPAIETFVDFLIENKWILGLLMLSMRSVIGVIGFLIYNWEAVVNVLRLVGNGFIWFINTIIRGLNSLMGLLTFGLARKIPSIPYLHSGTDFVPRTGPYVLERGEQVISKGNRGNGGIIINIDLRNAVVDNVDRLSRRIAEQVMMRIG